MWKSESFAKRCIVNAIHNDASNYVDSTAPANLAIIFPQRWQLGTYTEGLLSTISTHLY